MSTEKSDKPVDQQIKAFVADHINNDDDKVKTLTIRHGQAPKLLDQEKPNKLRHEGVISAPAKFYEKRKALHNPDKCHVIYDMLKGEIILVVDEDFENVNTHVVGKIIDNPDLTAFKINLGKSGARGIKELMEFLKFNRSFFADREQNMLIVGKLQNFKATVEKTIVDENNNRGNMNVSTMQKLEHDLAENFVLKMPIHKGGAPYAFKVDILCNMTDGGMHVWLESTELKEIQQTSTDQIMKNELIHFDKIVCIEK